MLNAISALIIGIFFQAQVISQNIPNPLPQISPEEKLLSSHAISLANRNQNAWMNEIFKDNILLNIAYLRDAVDRTKPVDWDSVREPFTYELVLKPGEVFAFHDQVLPQYKSDKSITTNSHYNTKEGFRSDGHLIGDGVCHLASIMYWAAKDANLESLAPANHDFAVIPEIPKEYGVAILYMTGMESANQKQNLYIRNDKENPIVFVFSYENDQLEVKVKELL